MTNVMHLDKALVVMHRVDNSIEVALAAVKDLAKILAFRSSRATIGVRSQAQDRSFKTIEPAERLFG